MHQIAPFDARFPNTNQSKHCWQSYSDYYKCIDARGEEFTGCKQFMKTFKSICPTEWVRLFFTSSFADGFVTLPIWKHKSPAVIRINEQDKDKGTLHSLLTPYCFSFSIQQVTKWDEQREEGTIPFKVTV